MKIYGNKETNERTIRTTASNECGKKINPRQPYSVGLDQRWRFAKPNHEGTTGGYLKGFDTALPAEARQTLTRQANQGWQAAGQALTQLNTDTGYSVTRSVGAAPRRGKNGLYKASDRVWYGKMSSE